MFEFATTTEIKDADAMLDMYVKIVKRTQKEVEVVDKNEWLSPKMLYARDKVSNAY